LKKTVARLLVLNDDYGTPSLIYALKKALKYKLYGFAYIQNILYQEMTLDIFDGTTAATAIADRLVYNPEILILE